MKSEPIQITINTFPFDALLVKQPSSFSPGNTWLHIVVNRAWAFRIGLGLNIFGQFTTLWLQRQNWFCNRGFKCIGPSKAIARMIWAAMKKGCRPLF